MVEPIAIQFSRKVDNTEKLRLQYLLEDTFRRHGLDDYPKFKWGDNNDELLIIASETTYRQVSDIVLEIRKKYFFASNNIEGDE